MKNILMKQQQQTKKYHNNNNQLLSLLKPSSYSSNIHQKTSHSLYTKQSHVRPLIHMSSSSSSIFKQTSRSFVVLGGGGGDNNSGNNNKNTGDNKNVYGPKCKKCNSSMTFNGMYKDREDSRGFLYKCDKCGVMMKSKSNHTSSANNSVPTNKEEAPPLRKKNIIHNNNIYKQNKKRKPIEMKYTAPAPLLSPPTEKLLLQEGQTKTVGILKDIDQRRRAEHRRLVNSHNARAKSSSSSTTASRTPASMLTPADIYDGLEEFVIGQERVKKVLSVSMHNHFQRLEYSRLQEENWAEERFQDRQYAEQIYIEMQRITDEELKDVKLSDYKHLYTTEKKRKSSSTSSSSSKTKKMKKKKKSNKTQKVNESIDDSAGEEEEDITATDDSYDNFFGFKNGGDGYGEKWVLEEEKYMDDKRLYDLKRRFEAHSRLGITCNEWNEEREKWLNDHMNGVNHLDKGRKDYNSKRSDMQAQQQQYLTYASKSNNNNNNNNNSNAGAFQPQQDKYDEMMRRPSLILSEQKAKEEARKSFFELDKPNVLICGPTGTGKTLMAKTLAKMANVPLVIADATSLTQAGYVGEDVESILYKLLQEADQDVAKAEQGIVYIDEIDKIGKRGRSANLSRDVSGEGVQQALLKMLEGSIVNVPLKRRQPNAEVVQIDTKNILFICGGAFSGITDLIAKRTVERGIGFNATVAANPYNDDNSHSSSLHNKSVAEKKKATEEITKEMNTLLDMLEPSDLSSYGLIPEFVGRFPLVTSTKALTEDQFVRILCEPKNALIKQYKELFSLQNVDFHATDDALRECAQIAITKRTGARGLRSIMENCLVDTMFDVPSTPDVNAVYLDADAVRGEGEVKILSNELTLEKYLLNNEEQNQGIVEEDDGNEEQEEEDDDDDGVEDLLEASSV